jgi:hypothetical protein
MLAQLIGVAGSGRQLKRCRQLSARGSEPAFSVQGFGQAAERHDLAVLVAGVAEQRQCLLEIGNGLLAFALAQPEAA